MEHLLPLKVEYLLMIGISLLWTVVYVLVIYKGYKDQSCGMPMPSICANITWEFLFTFIMPFHPLQQIVTLIWFLLDCIILVQYFYYYKNAIFSRRIMYAAVLTLLVIALLLHYGIAIEFHDKMGLYTAFGINLMMSLLFIKLLFTKELLGQSLSIAYYKMVGTLLASILCYSLYPQSVLFFIMYVLIFILDIAYIVMVYRRSIRVVPKSV